MRRRSKFLVFLPAAFLLSLALAMAWLLRSESGANFIWKQAGKQLDGQLRAQKLRGSLVSGLVVQGFSYRDDSVSVDSPDIHLSLDIDMFPPALNLTRLDSSSVTVELRGTAADENEESLAGILASLQLPYPVIFDDVNLGELRVLEANQAELFAADNIALQARWHQEWDIIQAELHSLDTDWQISARLLLQQPFVAKGSIAADTLLKLDDDNTLPLQLQADFDGTLERLATRLHSLQHGIEIKGELLDLLTQPGWDLQLDAATLHWPPAGTHSASGIVTAPLLTLDDISLSTQGTVNAFDLQLAALLSGEQIPGGSLELQGNGDGNGLQVDFLRLTGDELAMSATGALGWQEEFTLSADTRIETLHPQRWIPDWPQDYPLYGSLLLDVSTSQLLFSKLDLSVTGLATRLQGEGSYRYGDEVLAADLSWQELAWPIGAASPDITSRNGQLSLQGTLSDWQANGDLQLLASGFPEGRLQLKATGTPDTVHLEIPRGSVLGGEFAGEVDYQAREPEQWSARITADRIQLAPLFPDYPGVLSGTVLAQGEVESPTLRFELIDVRGRIRELDLAAQGKFSLQDGLVEADGLQLRSRSARLDLDGGMAAGQVLKFAAEADDLSELFPEAGGQLQASGELSLDAQAPRLDIKLNADELQWGENHIGQIRTTRQADGSTLLQLDQASLAGRE
ncbi:MAG TPA: hypothetical protein VFG52_03015, partial [Xanthomonadales bacterium]|nr:hypothetical protein [Xanthomonadales bacterium]